VPYILDMLKNIVLTLLAATWGDERTTLGCTSGPGAFSSPPEVPTEPFNWSHGKEIAQEG
jgi:hypothetical protein